MRFAVSLPGTGSAERLAGEPSANNVCCNGFEGADVAMTGNVRPMLGKDALAVWINLAKLDGSHSRSFKSETESADT